MKLIFFAIFFLVELHNPIVLRISHASAGNFDLICNLNDYMNRQIRQKELKTTVWYSSFVIKTPCPGAPVAI